MRAGFFAVPTVLLIALAGCAPTTSANDSEPYETFTDGYFTAESAPEFRAGEIPEEMLPVDDLSDEFRGWEWSMIAPGGYTALGQLEVGDIQPAGSTHSETLYVCDDGSRDCSWVTGGGTSIEFVSGEICGIDLSTDAVVPLIFRLEATTEGFPTALSGGISVTRERSNDDYLGMNRALSLEVKSTTWDDCDDTADGSASMSMLSLEPVDAGQGVGVPLFLIIPDYYVPSHPDGNPALLDLISFSPRLSAYADTSQSWSLSDVPTQYKDHASDRTAVGVGPYPLSGG